MSAKSRRPSTSDKMASGSTATPSAATPTDPASSGSRRSVPGGSGDGPAVPGEPSATPIFDALCAELGDPTSGPTT